MAGNGKKKNGGLFDSYRKRMGRAAEIAETARQARGGKKGNGKKRK